MGHLSILKGLTLGIFIISPTFALKAEIRADSNRDGFVDTQGTSDLAHKLEWSNSAGAIFLANIGDTSRRCSKLALQNPPSQEVLAACNDASDDVQRSPQYLAPLRTLPIPDISDDGWGTVGVHTEIARKNVRIFRRDGSGWSIVTNDDRFPANELKNGFELGIDARDTRRPSGWDGKVEVRFDIHDGKASDSDAVRLRVAPVITFHHLMPVSQVFVTNGNKSETPFQEQFVSDLRQILDRPDIRKPLFTFDHSDDIWAQDILEPAYTSMPSPQGPIILEIMIRSPQGSRVAGRQVFEYLRNGTRGAIYTTGGIRDEIDSTGNVETIPPYSYGEKSYPAGRIIQGSHGKSLPHLYDYLKAQEIQSPIILDVDWLAVGHVDEIVQFIPFESSPYGWALYIADPIGGINILEQAKKDGYGHLPAFSRPSGTLGPHSDSIAGDMTGVLMERLLGDNYGKLRSYSRSNIPMRSIPDVTINDILTDRLIEENKEFAMSISKVQKILERETGIPKEYIHHVPMVFETGFCFPPDEGVLPERNCSSEHAVALYPGVLNGVVLSDFQYLSPNPWGPVIDGIDIMAQAIDKVYGKAGMDVIYIDDWYSHHEGGGEVHCGTNTVRLPAYGWWESASFKERMSSEEEPSR
ncbi:hypothetical protein TrVFT333_007683 [Trichoderma virens FT-333]|nr:hypothetical protein TrVFT333_007683 [Trichoderma virens FT-333]